MSTSVHFCFPVDTWPATSRSCYGIFPFTTDFPSKRAPEETLPPLPCLCQACGHRDEKITNAGSHPQWDLICQVPSSSKGFTASKVVPQLGNEHAKYDPVGRGAVSDCPLSQATTILGSSAVLSHNGLAEVGWCKANVSQDAVCGMHTLL